MPGGDPVHGVCIGGNLGFPTCQLSTKSYRARPRCQRRFVERGDPVGEGGRSGDKRLPESLAGRRVKGSKRLPPARIENGEVATTRVCSFANAPPERIEGADPAHRQARARREAVGRGEAYTYADKRAGPEANRDSSDSTPTPGRGRRPLDLGEQRSRVPRTAAGRRPDQLLAHDLVAATDADRRVGGRSVETDRRRGVAGEVSPGSRSGRRRRVCLRQTS